MSSKTPGTKNGELSKDGRMFAQNRFRLLAALTIGLVLLLPAPILLGQKHKNKKTPQAVPEGIPVLGESLLISLGATFIGVRAAKHCSPICEGSLS
jgi:hypothetical protein